MEDYFISPIDRDMIEKDGERFSYVGLAYWDNYACEMVILKEEKDGSDR